MLYNLICFNYPSIKLEKKWGRNLIIVNSTPTFTYFIFKGLKTEDFCSIIWFAESDFSNSLLSSNFL